MKKLRKFLNVSVMVMTVLSMTLMGLTPNVQAAASAGDLIKMEGNASVYYFDGAKRFVFPNQSTYMSWYADFSGVITIPASELQSYPLGGNVTMRAGTKLVKITTDPSVYAVEPNGVLRKIQSEAQAASLYGTTWAQRVVDVPDAFFVNYSIGSVLASGSIPAGSLVKTAGSSDVYYFDGTNYRAIASEAAMTANRFSFANVLTIASAITAGGNAVSGMEEALVKTSQGSTTAGPVITGSGLMVSLNSMTPASQNIPASSSVEFLKINLTAANDGGINVSGLTLTAYGLSSGENIDEVTIYDGSTKVGTSKNINSDRVAIFNFSTPIAISAGATKTLTVKATVAVDSGSYGLGIAKASDVISTGAAVTGSFPVQGNLMSSVAGTSVGSIAIDSILNAGATASFGEDDVLLADFTLEANTEDALLKSISLYNGGTRDDSIISNLKLFIDGTEVAAGTYADRYATFALNNYEVKKSDTVAIEVRGDMGITSATDQVKLYLKDTADLIAIGKTHGFNMSISSSDFNASGQFITVTLSAGDFTIDMDKVAVPAKDVKPDTTNVVLATMSLTSNGENAILSGIDGNFFITQSGSTTPSHLENVELVDRATGGVYDLTMTASTTSGVYELSLDDEISFVKGIAKTFDVRADVKASAAENTTFRVTLYGGALDIEGDVSGADISDITPSNVSGSLITVKSASLSVNPVVLTNASVVGGGVETVYQAKVKAGTADGIKLQTVKLTASSTAFTNNNISKLELFLNGNLLRSVSNQISGGVVTFNSLNTAYNTVAAGAEVDLVVKATFSSSITAGNFELQITNTATSVTARSVVGNDSVSPTIGDGYSRLVTIADKGTLTVALSTSDAKANRDSFLLAGSETEANRYLGEIKFTTTKEAIKVKTLELDIASTSTATSQDISSVKLVKADGTVVATKTVDSTGDVTFDPFNVEFTADQSTSLFIVAVAKGINVNGDATATARDGKTVKYALGAVTATGMSSGEETTVTNSGGYSKMATVVGSKLNTVVNAMADATLSGGSAVTVGKYTLTFNNASNRDTNNEELKAILTGFAVKVATSTGLVVGNVNLQIDGTSNKATSTMNYATGVATWAAADLANGLTDGAKLDGAVTLVITADVSGTIADGYLQTSITDVDNIKYNSGVNHTTMYLPVTEVIGANLSR